MEKKGILIFVGIIIFCFAYHHYNLCDCKKRISYKNVDMNEHLDIEDLYKPIDSTYLNKIKAEWTKMEFAPDSINLEATFNYSLNREMQIISLFSKGKIHYSAIVFPKNYDEREKYPLILWAEGLNQNNPSVNFNNKIIRQIISQSQNYFILVPSFRGQALVTNHKRYCSDGFFGDAFDGAANDALGLISFAKNEINGVDRERITVIGVSRGGTVALLVGAKDKSIKNIVSISAPTNFFSKKTYNRYGKQYKYQFLSNTKSKEKIRKKMIESSPVYFIQDFPNSILLIHGKNDRVVNVSHAIAIIDGMKDKENFHSELNENGHEFYDWNRVIKWIKNNT